MKVAFGDLPGDAKAVLINATNIDFTPWDMRSPRWFSAWARDEHGFVAGLFTIEFKYPWEGYVNVVVLDQRCMTKRTLRAIFTAAFAQAVRLTAEIEPDNRRALRQVQRMGFVYEGFRRKGLEGKRDVLCYGMLREDCKFLPGYVRPPLSQLDLADSFLVDAVGPADSRPAAGVSPYREYLRSSKLHHLVALAVLAVGVTGAFGSVLAAGSPAQVPAIDTARSSTAMGGVFSSYRLAVRETADDAVHFPACTFVPHLRIASGVDRERPEEAVITGAEKGGGERVFWRVHPMYIGWATPICQIAGRLY